MTYSNELIDMAFADSPLEQLLAGLRPGDSVSAMELLTRTDGASDDAMEELFDHLEDLGATVCLDVPAAGATGQAALRLRQEQELVKLADLRAGLEQDDPLRLYLAELASIPVMGDEAVLAAELAQANRNETESGIHSRMVNLSLSRVVDIAREFVGHGVLMLDLIQEGSLGLWNGILSYTQGDFAAQRDWWVRQYMIRAVLRQARAGGLGQRMRQAVEDYRMVDERLLSELGRNPTAAEIGEQLHMTEEEVEAVRKTLDNARMVGKVHKTDEPQEDTPEADQAIEDTEYFQTRTLVTDLMSGLTEQESMLLNLRYGLDGKPPLTAAEAGERMGLTPGEAVEMETAALAKMRRGE